MMNGKTGSSSHPVLHQKDRAPRWIRILLIVLILVVSGLKIPGLYYGFPEIVFRDEITYAGVSLDMLRNGTLAPGEYRYGNLIHYAYAAFFSLLYYPGLWTGFYASMEAVPDWHFYLIARILSLLISAGSLGLIFILGQEIFNSRVGLWASVLLALNPTVFRYGQIAKLDIYVLFLTLVISLLFLRLYRRVNRRNLYLAGFIIGVGISTKYNMVALLPCLPGVYWLGLRNSKAIQKGSPKRLGKYLLQSLLIAGVTALVFNIFVLIHWEEALAQLQRQYRTTVQGQHLLAVTLPPLNLQSVIFSIFPQEMGAPITILALAGWLVWGFKDWKRWLIVSIYPLFQYAMVSRWGFAFPRELLPLMPMLYLGAGHAMDRIVKWEKRLERSSIQIIPLVLAGICIYSLINPVQDIYRKQALIIRGNTKTVAKAWCIKHIPPEAKIARDSFMLPMRETHPDEIFFHVLELNPYQYYVDKGVQYLIKSHLPQRVLEEHPEIAAHKQEIEQRAELLMEWRASVLGMEGPDLAVYRVKES